MKKLSLLPLGALLFSFSCLSCHKQAQEPDAVSGPWAAPSRKLVQKIEDEITVGLHRKVGEKVGFSDFYPEPSLKVASMGPDNEAVLIVTLMPFKTQGGPRVLAYRLEEGEPDQIMAFYCMTRDGGEIIPDKGEDGLLIHDEGGNPGKGRLYFLRDGRFQKVFEYTDTDGGYQSGHTFQTRLALEHHKLYLYRWDSPDGQRTFDDLRGDAPSRKLEFDWDEATGTFKKRNSGP